MQNDIPSKEYPTPTLTQGQIIRTLDIALLKPNATIKEVTEAASEAESVGAASVCVASYNVAVAAQVTRKVCSVIGFPHGNMSPDVKLLEAERAVEDGAAELDVVINYGRMLEGREVCVCQELESIVNMAHRNGVFVKAILESGFFESLHDLRFACDIAIGCGVDWLKTSTGFGPGGATPSAVEIMVEATEAVKNDRIVQVKASGGIKTYGDACLYLGMGCTRLGVGFTNYKNLLP
jgi:deoxyribose-phosphate aldolase